MLYMSPEIKVWHQQKGQIRLMFDCSLTFSLFQPLGKTCSTDWHNIASEHLPTHTFPGPIFCVCDKIRFRQPARTHRISCWVGQLVLKVIMFEDCVRGEWGWGWGVIHCVMFSCSATCWKSGVKPVWVVVFSVLCTCISSLAFRLSALILLLFCWGETFRALSLQKYVVHFKRTSLFPGMVHLGILVMSQVKVKVTWHF